MQLVDSSGYIKIVIQISALAKSIRVLADMEDPIGKVLNRTQVRLSSLNWLVRFDDVFTCLYKISQTVLTK